MFAQGGTEPDWGFNFKVLVCLSMQKFAVRGKRERYFWQREKCWA